jgi:hypothetical protein
MMLPMDPWSLLAYLSNSSGRLSPSIIIIFPGSLVNQRLSVVLARPVGYLLILLLSISKWLPCDLDMTGKGVNYHPVNEMVCA